MNAKANEDHSLRLLRQPTFGVSSACIAHWAQLLKRPSRVRLKQHKASKAPS